VPRPDVIAMSVPNEMRGVHRAQKYLFISRYSLNQY
jgi:hypothetical protein